MERAISVTVGLSGTFLGMRNVSAGSVEGTFDVALIGLGGAGMTILHELATIMRREPTRTIRVLVCDDVNRLAQPADDRTWCFWDAGDNIADPAVTASWKRLRLCVPGRDQVSALSRLSYRMIRSADYYRLVGKAIADVGGRLDISWAPAVTAVQSRDSEVHVHTRAGEFLARWALDSRPRPPKGAKTTLWQHFSGSYIRAHCDFFDPTTATLMDFRVRQPRRGVSFVYALPLDERTALVEYTEFTPTVSSVQHRRAMLEQYLKRVLNPCGFVELGAEEGRIPMSDAPLPKPQGRVVPIGTAGGATRGATGYTFQAMQRGAQELARQIVTAGSLSVPEYYPARHRAMDGVLLRGLERGTVDGPIYLERLFASHSADLILSFLDGQSTPRQDGRIMASAPTLAMMRAAMSRTFN